MKRTILLLLIVTSLGVIYFLTAEGGEEKKSTLSIEDRDFITTDRSAVGTITIKTKGRPMFHLSKVDDNWYLNNAHKASSNIVNNMIGALNVMQIQYIPSTAENQTALGRMDMHGIDIKTYDHSGKLLTDFVLGTNTNTEYGTYFRKSDSNQCYVMEIPARPGGLRNYFTQSYEDLREMTVFSFKHEDITKIEMSYPKDISNSYKITQIGNRQQLFSHSGESIDKININVVDAYLKDFIDLHAEWLKNGHVDKDTVSNYTPFAELKIESKNRSPFEIDIYSLLDLKDRGVFTRSVDDITPRHEKFYALTSDGDFFRVQQKLIERFLRKVDYFYTE